MEYSTRKSLRSLAEHCDSSVASRAARALEVISNQLPEEFREGLGPDTTLEDGLLRLASHRTAVPDKDPVLTCLDAAIIPLIEIEREMFAGGPYDIASVPAALSQLSGQGLFLDLWEANLHTEVSDLLGIRYLSKANSIQPPQRVEGILWGPGRRPLVCLPAQLCAGDVVNVFLLVDTGAHVTELSPSVFNALGCDKIPMASIINLGGFSYTHVRLCDQGEHSNHKDISILGADFLANNKCVLEVDYLRKTVVICFT